MVRKKVDDRVRTLIENGVKTHHRSLLVLVGDHGKDQVVNLHYILSRTQVKARPSVLWCYKNELGFSTHRKKRMRQIKRQVQRGLHDPDKDDPFDLFVSSTNIRWCYYKETHRVLGQTFGMCVLQDFEALTPNLLARTIETVEGGGLVILLLRSVASLKQLYTMTMDVHARFRTEAHDDVVARFNERFVLSLGDCGTCLVLDDELNVLPISKGSRGLTALPGNLDDGIMSPSDIELKELKESVAEMQPLGSLVGAARTVDQAKAVITFMEAIQEKTLKTTVSLTASRGRGKSAAVGLCLAGAIAFGYSNIYVTAPSPENLETVFDFVKRGLAALKYSEHLDYEVKQAGHHHHGQDHNNRQAGGADARAVVRISVFRQHRQTIQYIAPHEHDKLSQAELVAIDEAAAIPLPVVKRLIGNYLVFMSSTITGYEGTGRSLSLKLIQQLREQQGGGCSTRKLREVTLEDPIRYGRADPVEKWLHHVLCLDANISTHRLIGSVMPPAEACDLYCVNRDTLFSYHKVSEAFLQRVMALYTAAHYKNQPNDLQLLSDAPAHKLYVLLGPSDQGSDKLPDVLCVIQVALEGRISQASVQASLARGHRASGDLIPWNISQQFQDSQFAKLSGARIVRIATHPDAHRMGYGTRALKLLIELYEGKLYEGGGGGKKGMALDDDDDDDDDDDEDEEEESEEEGEGKLLRERVAPRKQLAPLLMPASQVKEERLHWLGTSFGLTESLLGFWGKAGLRMVYMRQTANDLTGEHTVVMLRALDTNGMEEAPEGDWLGAFAADALRRIVSLLSFEFRESMDTTLDLAVIDNLRSAAVKGKPITAEQLGYMLVPRDFERLSLYARNLVDYHMITDLLPTLSRLYFVGLLPESVHLSHLMEAILLGLGLRHRKVDALAREIGIDPEQLLAMFNKVIRKIGGCLQAIHDGGKGKQQQQLQQQPKKKVSSDGAATMTTSTKEGGPGDTVGGAAAAGEGEKKKKKKKRKRPQEEQEGGGEGENGAATVTNEEEQEEGKGEEAGEAEEGKKMKKKKKRRKETENDEEVLGNGSHKDNGDGEKAARANGHHHSGDKKDKKKQKYKNL